MIFAVRTYAVPHFSVVATQHVHAPLAELSGAAISLNSAIIVTEINSLTYMILWVSEMGWSRLFGPSRFQTNPGKIIQRAWSVVGRDCMQSLGASRMLRLVNAICSHNPY